jgi:hypothetical protein
MVGRNFAISIAAVAVWCAPGLAQEKPAGNAGAGISSAVEKEAKGLTAEDFPEREAALKRLRALMADQVKQRAEIQAVLNDLQTDLAKQQKALAVVTDEEAQAQIAGLLEMERGIAGWTVQVMGEPVERRKALLDWGLGRDTAAVLARVYSDNRRVRLAGVKELAKMPDDVTGGAAWTLSRLINDPETPVRAAAMAACWSRKPTEDVVGALWFRAVTGPQGKSSAGADWPLRMQEQAESLKVDFPGGEPMEFDNENEAAAFEDAELAGDVLIQLNSPLVAERVKGLVEERRKAGKSLVSEDDPDWTLVSHRLVEAYGVKEAIPTLAEEALAARSDEMGGDMNGRPFMWSSRSMAIGVLCKLVGKDPADFQVVRVRGADDPRAWIWAVDANPGAFNGNGGGGGPAADGAAVRAFYAWWKDHHGEYGVKEEPSAAGLPRPGRGRRGGGPAIIPSQGPAGGAPETAPADAGGRGNAEGPAINLPAMAR